MSLLKRKKKTSFKLSVFNVEEKAITLSNIFKRRSKSRKLILVLAIFIPVIAARKKVVENTKDAKNP